MSLWVRGTVPRGCGSGAGLLQVFLPSPWTSGSGACLSRREWQELKSQAEHHSTFKGAHDMPRTFYWPMKHHDQVQRQRSGDWGLTHLPTQQVCERVGGAAGVGRGVTIVITTIQTIIAPNST